MNLSRGNVLHREKKPKPDNTMFFTGGAFGCGNRCKYSWRACLKRRGVDLKENRILFAKQVNRYDSWQQTIKEGRIALRTSRFNELESVFGRKANG